MIRTFYDNGVKGSFEKKTVESVQVLAQVFAEHEFQEISLRTNSFCAR